MNLPLELIILIINFLIPPNPPIAFPASDPVTKTLLSLTRVSKSISKVAKGLLLKHCLYIDRGDRLRILSLRNRGRILTPNLILSLCKDDWEDEPLIAWFFIFTSLSMSMRSSLTRFVLCTGDMWVCSNGVKLHEWLLRRALARLTKIEDFCSIDCDIRCIPESLQSGTETAPRWINLRRLALAQSELACDKFVETLSQLPNLTHLVLVDPIFPEPSGSSDDELSDSDSQVILPRLQRLVLVVDDDEYEALVDWLCEQDNFLGWLWHARLSGARLAQQPGSKYILRLYSSGGLTYRLRDTRKWFLRHATAGNIWDLEEGTYYL